VTTTTLSNQPAAPVQNSGGAAATKPLAAPAAVATDVYEPNNSSSEAKSLGDLKMRDPSLVIYGNFDTTGDTEDWFSIRIIDDGTAPGPNYPLHHLQAGFGPPNTGDDYQITIWEMTALQYSGWSSPIARNPSVTYTWPMTTQDDTRTLFIRVRRVGGTPNPNLYAMVIAAD
jgi:hypothetical protein